MANDVNINITAKDKATGPIKKVGRSVKQLGKEASKSGKTAKGDWQGLGDLFSGLLPRGLQSTLRGFKGAQRQIGRLSKSFKVLKGAIAATGLGLLVVALGEIVANWDSITGAITRASKETREQVDLAKENAKAAEDQLGYISEIENILKLQGKTEEEILAMRMQATDEAIAAQRIVIDSLKQQQEEQTKAAETSEKVAQAMIALLSMPITYALAAIDEITGALAQLGLMDEGTDYLQAYLDAGTELLGLDADKISEEGEAAVEEAEDKLLKLENTRAGYQLRKNKNEEDEEKNAQAKRDKAAEQAKADAEFRAQQLEKIERDIELRKIEDDEKREQKKREMQYKDDEAALKARGATLEELEVLEEQYEMDKADITQKYSDQRKAKEQQEALARQALEDELYAASLSDYDRELLQLQQLYDRRVAIAGDDEGLILAAQEDFLKRKQALDDKAAEDETELLEGQAEMREFVTRASMELVGNLNELFTKESEKDSKKAFQRTKALSISETLISTYFAAQKAYASQFLPLPDPSSPIRGTLAAAVAVTAGLAKVKAIKAQQYGGGASAGSGGGGGARRSGFGPTQQQLPTPARLNSPDSMQAFVVQTQLQGQMNSASKLTAQTIL